MKSKPRQTPISTPLLVTAIIFILALAGLAIVPLSYALITGDNGVRTEGIDTSSLKESTTDLDGTWEVSHRLGSNQSSVGFTFMELLPVEEKRTSGSTNEVDGEVRIEGSRLTEAEIVVDMATIETDNDRRDINVRRSILNTDQYPTARFTLTQPVDMSQLPEGGTTSTVTLTGDLTIHGTTNSISQEFEAVRSGEHIIASANVPISREDYGVETPEFVAAKIADEGELNIRLNLEKKH